ncbi:similar to An04g00770 [Aspergillus tubingensis]|uniref:Similar to An04g00770 n=1 Tax=Aspergillus niger TaxID=5061 RepID=A0A100I9R8_ASPNG|nr:similar to An04g00770 [Aspergillus tubingensis]GAQ37306.1 similar to An04g00770 [Aspergillus niger]GFN12814.1 similar to An04g00770 [Aspergillus tubingensis]
MDHKIDTLATLHNWTQGTPSLYPFTGIIQLYLAEEISVVTAVGEISAFMEKRGEGLDECVHDLWASILHAGRCLPCTNIMVSSATAEISITSNGHGGTLGEKIKKKETIDTDISHHQTPTPSQKKLIALMHAIKNMPDVHVHVRARTKSRYSYSAASQVGGGRERERYSSYGGGGGGVNGDITERNENGNGNEEHGGGEDEGESTEEEELYHPSLGVYLDGTVGGSHYIRHLHDPVAAPVPPQPQPPPPPIPSEPRKNTNTNTQPQNQDQPQPEENSRPKPPKLPSSASESTIRPTKTKSLVWAYLPHFRDVVGSIFTDFGDVLGMHLHPFPHPHTRHQQQYLNKMHPRDQKVLHQAWLNFITFLAFLAREGVLHSPSDSDNYAYGFDEYDWGFDHQDNNNNSHEEEDECDGVGSWIDDLAISCLWILENLPHQPQDHHHHHDKNDKNDHLQNNTQILTATTFALLYGEHLWRRRGIRTPSHPHPPSPPSPSSHQEKPKEEKDKEKEREKEKEKEKDNYIVAGLTLDEFESGSVSASTSTSAANSPPLAVSPPPNDGDEGGDMGRFITRKTWEGWIRRFNELAGDVGPGIGMGMGLWDGTREGAWLAGEVLRRVISIPE